MTVLLSHSEALLARQAARESNARSYPRRLPLALVRAAGMEVTDADGRTYLDCLAGAGSLALGHRHPAVVAAVRAAIDDGLPWQTLDLTTPVKDALVTELLAVLPADFAADARVQFCGPTGADAVEAALKLVRTATGRAPVLAFQGGYHGMTAGALAATGAVAAKAPLAGGLGGAVHHLPFPYPYRDPFGLHGDAGWRTGLRYLRTVLDDPEGGVPAPAAVLAEPVQGEGGVIPAPDAWLRGVRALTAERDVPLVLDEVQTGLGRTGRLFAFEHSGAVPDVLVLSKAIGGGLPLALVVYRGGLDRWAPGAHAGTFRGNQLAMVAGLATLRVLLAEDLPAHAAAMGARLLTGLRALQAAHPCLGDVRGRGLMLGAEVVDPDADPARDAGPGPEAPPAAPHLARRLQAACLDRGLIVELGGRHGAVVRFLPPLIITPDQVDGVLSRFADALDAVA